MQYGFFITACDRFREKGVHLMQSTQFATIFLMLTLGLPNLAFAKDSVHPTIIFLSATIVFLMILTVYIVYKIRHSVRNHLDKPLD
jgi:hypothetical protein